MVKLTKKEQAWVDELQEVLDRCPSPKKSVFTPSAIRIFTFMTCANTKKLKRRWTREKRLTGLRLAVWQGRILKGRSISHRQLKAQQDEG